MKRQLDALQQHDKHKHDTPSRNSCCEAGEIGVGESPDSEELQPEHRVIHLAFYKLKDDQQRYTNNYCSNYPGVSPAHSIGDAIMFVRHQGIGYTYKQRCQPTDED